MKILTLIQCNRIALMTLASSILLSACSEDQTSPDENQTQAAIELNALPLANLDKIATQPSTVYLQNRWLGTYAFDAGNEVHMASNPNSSAFAWRIEPLENGEVAFRNANTGDYLHTENQTGKLESTERNTSWQSAKWRILQNADNTYHICSAWIAEQCMNIEHQPEQVGYGKIWPVWESAQWQIVPVEQPTPSPSLSPSPTPSPTTEATPTVLPTPTPDVPPEVTPPPPPTQTPPPNGNGGQGYFVEAENFDNAYDLTEGNAGSSFRDGDVDIQATTDTSQQSNGGYNVGWMDSGEWLEYANINVETGTQFTLRLRVASPNNGAKVGLRFDNSTIPSQEMDVPNTGNWQQWQTIETTIVLPAGSHRLRVNVVAGGWNLNWIEITERLNIAQVYQHCDFSGWSIQLGAGSYSQAQLSALGFTNNDASSLRLAEGFEARVFSEDGLNGSSQTLTNDVNCFESSPGLVDTF